MFFKLTIKLTNNEINSLNYKKFFFVSKIRHLFKLKLDTNYYFKN